VTHFIATGRDVTDRLTLEERLRELAYYDPLTGLPNKAHLEERLGWNLPSPGGAAKGLILLDLDRFKNLNDTLGHPAGDDLLKQVGQRLWDSLSPSDLLARLGGDEFVCFLDGVDGAEGAARRAEALLSALRTPFRVDDHTFTITASLGICLAPEDGEQPSALLQHADTAMFEAKGAGGNQYRFFSRSLSEAAAERFFLEKGMRQALDEDGVQAWFQPVFDLGSGEVVGAEALARCWFPEEGWVSPGRFIPVAEETGLIQDLGERILDQALARFRTWQDAGHQLERVAVNLSPLQLESETLPDRIRALLDRHGVAPCFLELEITEEAAMREEAKILDRIHQLQELGVEIALDDFGTGFSSPVYLRRLPASRMKIDRTFIRGIDHDLDNQTILHSLLVLAEGFGFRVTAEGVETEAEAAYLRRIFCQEVQGFLYGHPTAADDFGPAFLARSGSPAP
jgi:diguanylate cyclase (GGDEF)-like protein